MTATGRSGEGALAERPRTVFCLLEADGRARFASDSMAEVFGLPAREVIGRRVTEAVHTDDLAVAADAWSRALEHPGVEVRSEFRITNADGELRWVEAIATNLLDDAAVAAVVVTFRDVTEQREAEIALRANERMLRTVIDNTTDGLILVDDRGRIRWGSPAVRDVLGYDPTAFDGHSVLDFVHPDDVAAALPSLARVTSGRTTAEPLLVRVRHADGTWRWVEALTKRLDGDPSTSGAMFSVRDVTDRVTAEQALRASEERFRAFFQSSKDLTVVVDFDATIQWLSPNVEDMLGYPPDDLIGRSAFGFIPAGETEQAAARFAEALTQESPTTPFILHLIDRHGAQIPVEALGTVLPGPDLEPEGVIVSIRDIRARLEAEAAIRRGEERFQALVQHSSDAVIVMDADAVITYVSPAARTIFGFPASEVEGTQAFTWIHPDDFDWVTAEFAEVSAEPASSRTREFRVNHRDGGYRWVEATVVNMLDTEAVGGIVANIRDVTDRRATEDALRSSETRFRTVVSNSYDVVAVVDADGVITWVTDNSVRLLGWEPAEVIGTNGLDLVHPDDLDLMLRELTSFTEGQGRPNPTTIKMRHKDGSWHHVELVGTDLLDNPDIQGIALNLRGADDRVASERDLRRLTDIFELTSDLVGITSADGGVVYLNRAARAFFGVPEGTQPSSTEMASRFSVDSRERIASEVAEALAHGVTWSGELEVIRADGAIVSVLGQMIAHRDADGNLEFLSGVLRDISERKALESRLEHEATHDPLTGLPNRTLLLDRLEQALGRSQRRGTSVGLLFCDLDHFKFVNDSMGHSAGDRLLVDIGTRLQGLLRPGDTVSRFGGDEFVVLCEDIAGLDDAVTIAKRVLHAVGHPFELGERSVHVGASIGISMAEGGRSDAEALIREADAAMYRAKARGRNRFQVFEADMWEQAVDRFDLENALRRALGRGELELVYQPIVALPSGRVEGFEALLRWRHPDRGRLRPEEFIGVAEETGVIVGMGTWVLHEACRQLQAFHAALPGSSLTMAVNLSGRQLAHPELVDQVAESIAETGIDAGSLHLEITESALMDDVERSRQTLQMLKALGVNLAVDDFGTGYSSLSYLRRFPVDTLKVDRSFVDGVGEEPEDSAIVAAIINLAHTLGLRATAEGVETERQLRAVEELGCDSAQGFLIAEPMEPDDVPALLHRRGHRSSPS